MASAVQTIVLITGANQGLGFECVKKLAAEQPNYHILLCSRDHPKGRSAATSITEYAKNTSVEALELDVLSDSSIEKAAKYVEERFGRLDVLFNNAAIAMANQSSVRAEMLRVYETNTVSPVCLTEAFVPLLKKSKLPKLLFMSSGLGSITYTLSHFFPFYGLDSKAYITSKAALNMIAAQYAVKYGKEGFKVNAVDPGFRSTNMTGYTDSAGDPKVGALEACRLIASGKDGQHATFASLEGIHPW